MVDAISGLLNVVNGIKAAGISGDTAISTELAAASSCSITYLQTAINQFVGSGSQLTQAEQSDVTTLTGLLTNEESTLQAATLPSASALSTEFAGIATELNKLNSDLIASGNTEFTNLTGYYINELNNVSTALNDEATGTLTQLTGALTTVLNNLSPLFVQDVLMELGVSASSAETLAKELAAALTTALSELEV